MDIYATARALVGRIGRSLVHASPVRLLLIICITIGATHSLTMLSLQYWHTILPAWAHSLTESVLLVAVLFPVIYISSFRPLVEQAAECRRAEEIMRESEHKYRQLFDCLGDGALLFDAQTGRVIDANQESERMFRRPRAEILGKRCDIFFPAEKAQEYRQRMVPRSSGTPTSFEAELQTPTGNGVPVHISVAALRLFGRDLIVSLFRDMTEFKLLHADLLRAQRMDSAGKLASRIAHDLNNLLTPILVATELLSQTPREKK